MVLFVLVLFCFVLFCLVLCVCFFCLFSLFFLVFCLFWFCLVWLNFIVFLFLVVANMDFAGNACFACVFHRGDLIGNGNKIDDQHMHMMEVQANVFCMQ